jgi:hypothetical protein
MKADGVRSPGVDLLVIQIDTVHTDEDLVLVAAIGAEGRQVCAASPRVRRRTPRLSRRSSTIGSVQNLSHFRLG